MKSLLSIILSIFIFVNFACSQQSREIEKLEGKWKYDGYECPDVLVFNINGTYNIYNDCGSIDPINPIIEKGKWKLEPIDSILILFQREFISPNSVFSEYHGKNERVLFKINELTEEYMVLCFRKDFSADCTTERYKRMR